MAASSEEAGQSPVADVCMSESTPRSLMQTVWERMGNQPNASTCSLGKCGVPLQCRAKRIHVRLCFAVSAPITIVFFILHLGRFCLSQLVYSPIKDEAPASFTKAVEAQWEEGRQMLAGESMLVMSLALVNLDQVIEHAAMDVLDRAVDGVISHLLFERRFFSTMDCMQTLGRHKIAYGMWVELDEEDLSGADSLVMALSNGCWMRVNQHHLANGQNTYEWYDKAADSPVAFKRNLSQSTFNSSSPVETVSAPTLKQLQYYEVQRRQASATPTGPLVQLWSGLDQSEGAAGVAWTAPIAYCGNYSCFEGVVAATVLLQRVSSWCADAWGNLTTSDGVKGAFANNSAVFIIQQESLELPTLSDGLLIAWSGADTSHAPLVSEMEMARSARDPVVRQTTLALLAYYGSLSSASLTNESVTLFSFDLEDDRVQACTCVDPAMPSSWRCLSVATYSTALDSHSRWLLVGVLPSCSLGNVSSEGAVQASQEVFLVQLYRELTVVNGVSLAVVVLVIFVVAIGLVKLVSPDLRSLSRVVQELECFDFKHARSDRLVEHRAFITDLSDLQEAFCRLSRGVQAFARFVPEAVVRNILTGSERARRLHVSRREVTAMFSNISGFAEIAETLSETELMLVLTRYLTVMTQMVEESSGIVAEILGDGMLAFWNTPDDTEDHPSLACTAALDIQVALRELNAQFNELGLPELTIRSGLHTGTVLSGNLGSETKMKFGCMGDAVNLASRLQGLCNHYDADIVCSGATHALLRPSFGLNTRKLDLVQVKGKNEPTWIFEVVGANGTRPDSQPLSPRYLSSAQIYEEALRFFQAADFMRARDLAEEALRRCPGDGAAGKLLERAQRHLGPDDRVLLSEEERANWTGVHVMTGK